MGSASLRFQIGPHSRYFFRNSMLNKLLPFKVFRSIEYFGHKIRLRKTYFSMTSYALDPQNIPMAEVSRLESIMQCVPFGPVFNSKNELFESFAGIRFPGYGSFYANQLRSQPQRKLELLSMVIPCTKKDRYFVVEENPDGSFSVVADFTAEALGVVGVREQDGLFEFLSRSDEVVFVKKRNSTS